MQIANSDLGFEDPSPVSSGDYWRRIFANNPGFSSWQEAKQSQVRGEIVARLQRAGDSRRVLDYGIGNLGLYRSLDEELLESLQLTGISESQQHNPDDELIRRFGVEVKVEAGLGPLRRSAQESHDCVISSYVFDYLDDADRAQLLQEFARILVPKGELILVLHHPEGRRNRLFKESEDFWRCARQLYVQLLEGRYGRARRTLIGLLDCLNERFPDELTYRKYLESYIRTGARLLPLLHPDRGATVSIPEAALTDCEVMIGLITREYSMTCKSFRPIEDPETRIDLPAGLQISRFVECVDPADRTPIANFFCATKP